jgi:hypothetical protein
MIEVKDLGGGKWKLLRPIVHYTHDGNVLFIPKGFVTDFATVPQFLWALFPPLGEDKLAFVVHDYLYTVGHSEQDRLYADIEMQHTQKSLGASTLRYTLMFWGVRLFGGAYFANK